MSAFIPRSEASGLFPATHWSAVLSTGGEGAGAPSRALEQLAKAYWYPLYYFTRQRGRDHHEAADAVQGFFMHVIRQKSLRQVEVRETRFRTFLLAAFKNWLATEYARAGTQKRGGGAVIVPLDELNSLSGSRIGPAGSEAPVDELFDQAWARNIFERAVAIVSASYVEGGRGELCKELLAGVRGGTTRLYGELAAQFGLSEGAVQKAAFDLRARIAAALRREIRQTVNGDADVDDELRYLIRLLRQ